MQTMPFHQETDDQPRAYDPPTIAQRATRSYANLFEHPGEDDTHIRQLIRHRSRDWHDVRAALNQDDIRTAIYSMARGRTTGFDGIPAEAWQAAADTGDWICMMLAWAFNKRIFDIDGEDGDDDDEQTYGSPDTSHRTLPPTPPPRTSDKWPATSTPTKPALHVRRAEETAQKTAPASDMTVPRMTPHIRADGCSAGAHLSLPAHPAPRCSIVGASCLEVGGCACSHISFKLKNEPLATLAATTAATRTTIIAVHQPGLSDAIRQLYRYSNERLRQPNFIRAGSVNPPCGRRPLEHVRAKLIASHSNRYHSIVTHHRHHHPPHQPVEGNLAEHTGPMMDRYATILHA